MRPSVFIRTFCLLGCCLSADVANGATPEQRAANEAARTAAARGDLEEARQHLIRALEQDPDIGILFENLQDIAARSALQKYRVALGELEPLAPLRLRNLPAARPEPEPAETPSEPVPERVRESMQDWLDSWRRAQAAPHLALYADGALGGLDGQLERVRTLSSAREMNARARLERLLRLSDDTVLAAVQVELDNDVTLHSLLQWTREGEDWFISAELPLP